MHVAPFLAVAAIVIVTPGVDMALVTKVALQQGRTGAQAAAVGVNVGIFLWTVAAAVGLAGVIAASATAFTAIKLAGAAYLVYLGVRSLLGSRHARPPRLARRGGAFRQGLTSNLLNPKIAVFFTSLLPQFVDGRHAHASDLLLLGLMFNAMGVAWLLFYAIVASRGRNLLARPRVKRALDRLTGAALIALGGRLALERR